MVSELEPHALVIASAARRRLVVPALAGFRVTEAEDEGSVYNALLAGVPDLVVADISPTTREIRETLLVGLLASPGRPPFILIAPPDGGSLAAPLLRRGATCALREPLDPLEMRLAFRRARDQRARDGERAQLLGDLAAMRSFVHDAFLNIVDGVVVVDATSQVLFANDEAARILLVDREQLVGSRLDPIKGAPLFEALKLARSSPERRASLETLMISGDDRLDLVLRSALVHDHLGRPAGGMVVIHVPDPKRGGVAALVAAAARGLEPAPARPEVAHRTPDTPKPIPRPPTAEPPRAATPAASAPRPTAVTPRPAVTPPPTPRPTTAVPRPAAAQAPAEPAPKPTTSLPRPAAAQPPAELDAARRTASFMIGDIKSLLQKKPASPPPPPPPPAEPEEGAP